MFYSPRKQNLNVNPHLNLFLGEGEFECACGDGYKGKVCEQMEKCQYVSCENGGKCREDSSAQLGFKCECPPGTAGENLQTIIFNQKSKKHK